MNWYPPCFTPYYELLGAEAVERIVAAVLNFAFEEPRTDIWENEGGR